MFKNTFQSGFLSILYSIGSKPLQIWDKKGACPWLQSFHESQTPHLLRDSTGLHRPRTPLCFLLCTIFLWAQPC